MIRPLALLCSCWVAAVHAQSTGGGPAAGPPPANWVSASFTVQQAFEVNDGDTHTHWNFQQALQYRAAIDRSIGHGITLGVGLAYATPNMTYSPRYGAVGVPIDCATSCAGSGNIAQALITARGSLDYVFRPIYQVSIGVASLSGFREASGETLPPNGRTGLTGGLGLGIGYAYNDRTELDLLQEGWFMATVNRTAGSSIPHPLATGVGFRFGF
ncbi:MAG TPA: hypothetical protein VMH39_02880 [Gemmatimonadaceae bacterium]|nr:hypothetical protein [Gemmatimonadaceae bacterium]